MAAGALGLVAAGLRHSKYGVANPPPHHSTEQLRFENGAARFDLGRSQCLVLVENGWPQLAGVSSEAAELSQWK
ncbi:unnamed protein product [Plutella xylostella]|uniref:(diamondback moth) hypothetical protein n=1 Tax=Plutella xylostella TaxID=51655 RepID=A0A8S4F1D1_PLUXY|nr:unnamed protein product [Plutella xylostella]